MHCFTSCWRLVEQREDSLDIASRVSSCWSCASWRCFSPPRHGSYTPLLTGAPPENIPPAIAEAALPIALKSRLRILETIKP